MLGELQHFGELLTRNARLHPTAFGLADGRDRWTWGEAEARANRVANALRGLGLRRGERVAVLASNRLDAVSVLFACARMGLVTLPINTMLGAAEISTLLEDSEAAALLADGEHLERARDAATSATEVRIVLGFDDVPSRGEVEDFAALVEDAPETPPPLERPIADEELLMLLYTSGTTGLPKGVMYGHRAALVGTLVHVLAIGSHRRHRLLLPSPLYSAAGFAGLACAVAVASPSHIRRFSVQTAFETLSSERITFTNLVPTTLHLLLEHERRADFDLSSLELLLYGGSPMPESTLRRAAGELDCGFRQTFATSETGLAGTVLEPEDHALALRHERYSHRLRSCGRPQVGVGVEILGEDWQRLPDGEVGDIAVCCDANMLGYWNRPEATAEVLRDGWLKTGDVARRDEDGFFYLVDRKKDMIVTGALNVFPSEVERELRHHPAVRDCCVVGLPDATWGEAVTAFVVLHRETRAEELLAHCRPRLAGYKRPKRIFSVDEIPRNPAGKPLRRVLRRRYGSGKPHSPEDPLA